MKILFFGNKGWIGNQFINFLKTKSLEIINSSYRADDFENVYNELINIKPSHVVCMIGRTHGLGYTTIDYLEQPGKLKENLNDNLFSPVVLSMLCSKLNIHLTYLGTGCIFENINDNHKFNENDLPNFFGSSYSIVKGYTDRLMHVFEKLDFPILNVRIRMPINDENNQRNFISKIISYSKICSIDNSMSVLHTLFPVLYDLIEKNYIGTFNLTNPGVISHNEILQMYKDIVDNNFNWENFSIEEQNKILLSKRSNNHLDTTKLENLYPNVLNINEAVKITLLNMKK
jgi:dTDP-4-dehydrorhamnose reductase